MSHNHSHSATRGRGRITVALAITVAVFGAQVVGSVITGSLALVVDAAHLLTDAGGLAIALIAASLASRPPTAKRTWGWGRAEVLGATAQAAILLAAGVFVLIEAIRRFIEPPEIVGNQLVVFGLIGLIGNIASLAVLASARNANLNIRAAFLEVLSDAIGSVVVIIAALVIAMTGSQLADAIAAILIGAFIVPRALVVLRDAASVLLESTPNGLDLEQVREHLLELEHVQSVHDLHVSQIATGLPVLTAHIVVDDECFYDGHAPRLLGEFQDCVAQHFPVQIEHSTFQLELASHSENEHPPHN